MKIKEYYLEAIKYEHHSLRIMIDFLVKEKKVISMNDDESVMDRYFLPKNADRMNKLLREYMQQKEG